MSTRSIGAPFEERQKFTQPWVWAIMLSPLVFAPWTTAVLLPVGGIAALFYAMEMVVRVEPDALDVRFVPFVHKRIPYADIASCAPRTYNPLGEYGGWGVRGFGKNRALNVKGNRGVQLELTNGDRILLGSQNPEALANAINRHRGV